MELQLYLERLTRRALKDIFEQSLLHDATQTRLLSGQNVGRLGAPGAGSSSGSCRRHDDAALLASKR